MPTFPFDDPDAPPDFEDAVTSPPPTKTDEQYEHSAPQSTTAPADAIAMGATHPHFPGGPGGPAGSEPKIEPAWAQCPTCGASVTQDPKNYTDTFGCKTCGTTFVVTPASPGVHPPKNALAATDEENRKNALRWTHNISEKGRKVAESGVLTEGLTVHRFSIDGKPHHFIEKRGDRWVVVHEQFHRTEYLTPSGLFKQDENAATMFDSPATALDVLNVGLGVKR